MHSDNSSEYAGLTPMLRQYFDLKAQNQDTILMFRIGDFYEIFGEDAIEVAKLLDIVLTSREKGSQNEKIPFCGVPHHSAQGYWLKLINLGRKVAIAEQMEDASSAKGLLKREIVRIMTPGCLDELEGLNAHEPNFIFSVYEEPETKQVILVIADITTGLLRSGPLPDVKKLISMIEIYRPKELLCRSYYAPFLLSLTESYRSHSPLVLSHFNEAVLRDAKQQLDIMNSVFANSWQHFNIDIALCIPAITGLFAYLRSLHFDIRQFLNITPLQDASTMVLQENVLRDLEIFETSRRRQVQGSLYSIINHTLSPMGGRLLRQNLTSPLTDKKLICDRQNTVTSLLNLGEIRLEQARQHIRNLPDLERLATRMLHRKITPFELQKLQLALNAIIQFSKQLLSATQNEFLNQATQSIENISYCQKLLEEALAANLVGFGSGQGVFRPGYDTDLDELTDLIQNGQQSLDNYAEKLRKETQISSLKIKYHKSYGHLIEVTKSHLIKVPSHFIRRQTMVNCERFLTPELQELDEKITLAADRLAQKESALYALLLDKLSSQYAYLKSACDTFATLDVLQAFAWLALKNNYNLAKFSNSGELKIVAGRHPMVEACVAKNEFTPNDLYLSATKSQAIITGPNMAGKSTLMRQTAVIAILNQIGSYVPALSAELPIFDQIFTRIGASDDLSQGQSTFMVEMTEAALILREATKHSLVILDEVGRGTSTQDGLAIASAILDDLANRLRCYCLFATHYHELIPFSQKYENILHLKAEVEESSLGIRFTHKVIPGVSGRSFGIEVAKLAGIPNSIIERAQKLIEQNTQEQGGSNIELGANKRNLMHLKETSDSQNSDFSEICELLRSIAIPKTTPLQALNIIAELQSMLLRPKQREIFTLLSNKPEQKLQN
ncbi:MAG: DNA mismatch repair protein MutS [Oligoflexales bacterium]|nr:DNA mismatch repair protein MutS [Oligoflexales bacterium]